MANGETGRKKGYAKRLVQRLHQQSPVMYFKSTNKFSMERKGFARKKRGSDLLHVLVLPS